MLLREVEYARPSTRGRGGAAPGANDGARALAGGQTLVNVMKARAASPDVLVDLKRLDDLRAISVAGDGRSSSARWRRYTQIMALVRGRGRAADPRRGRGQIADVQVRNRGTIGGNVCSNDPTNHLPPLLVALDATFTIRGAGGERTVSAEEFFLGVYLTAVGRGRAADAVRFPRPAAPATGSPR